MDINQILHKIQCFFKVANIFCKTVQGEYPQNIQFCIIIHNILHDTRFIYKKIHSTQLVKNTKSP